MSDAVPTVIERRIRADRLRLNRLPAQAGIQGHRFIARPGPISRGGDGRWFDLRDHAFEKVHRAAVNQRHDFGPSRKRPFLLVSR